jgi:hypothetical protein
MRSGSALTHQRSAWRCIGAIKPPKGLIEFASKVVNLRDSVHTRIAIFLFGACERWISVTALLAVCLRPQSALRPLKRGEGAADYPQRNSQRPWISLFGQVFLVQNNDQ